MAWIPTSERLPTKAGWYWVNPVLAPQRPMQWRRGSGIVPRPRGYKPPMEWSDGTAVYFCDYVTHWWDEPLRAPEVSE